MTDTSTNTDRTKEAVLSGSHEGVRSLSIQKALNEALADELTADPRLLVFGEDVGELGGVFRVTDGLQARFGADRVFNTPLAESGIVGTAIGLAMAGWHPVPEIQFDGFTFPAFNQIVTQLARMNYRTRGHVPMPVTLRIPSFGGIRAPEMHGESIEALLVHIPGLKVVSPSTPDDAYHLLRHAIRMPDPVMFLEPKSRYWNKGDVDTAATPAVQGARVARAGTDLTVITWGAMVARSLEVAELAAEDGVDIEVVDLRWLSPIDEPTIIDSVRRTRRAVVVHEAARTGGLGGEITAIVQRECFDTLAAPVERVTGYDVPVPPGDLEDQNIPDIDRILSGIQRVLEYNRG